MSKFNECRYCQTNRQIFSFSEYERFGEPPLYSDFKVLCSCGNRTMLKADSFDLALAQWNEENPVEVKEAERICKNCMHRVGGIVIHRCDMHNNKQVNLTETCDNFLGW